MNPSNLGTTTRTPNLGRAELEDHGALDDAQLAAVTGGRISTQHPAKVTVPDLKVTIGF